MKLVMYYKTASPNECVSAYVSNNSLLVGSVLSLGSGISSKLFSITNEKINNGATVLLDIHNLLLHITNYRVTGGTIVELQSGKNNTDKRLIVEYDDSIPMAFKRASSIINLGVL